MTPRIYCWVNARNGPDWLVSVGVAEDGTYLAGHVSSSEGWARHDMGFGESLWKHDLYKAHYPGGFELVWVGDYDAQIRIDERFVETIARNIEQGRAAGETERAAGETG